jgi:Ser/Thr protein kinase RdoA (MazF antagonist)
MSARTRVAGNGWRTVDHDESDRVLRGFYSLNPERVDRLVRDSLNSVWRIQTADGEFLLKRLGRPAEPEWLKFQHAAMVRAASCGIPAEPLIKTADGATTVETDCAQWQLRRYVRGRLFIDGSDADLAAAADVMAKLHATPLDGLPANCLNPIQDLEHWLVADESAIGELGAAIASATSADTWHALRPAYLGAYRRARENLDIRRYTALPQVLTHGEFAGSNLVFDKAGTIVGLLDWDGVDVRPRVYDIARGVLFLARTGRGKLTVNHQPAVDLLIRATANNPASREELAAITPILELYFVPTIRYVQLLSQRSHETLRWYLNWSAEGAASVRRNLASVVTGVAAHG